MSSSEAVLQPVKIDLNKKSFPKQKTIQNFNIDAQGFRKTKNENPPTWEIRVTTQCASLVQNDRKIRNENPLTWEIGVTS